MAIHQLDEQAIFEVARKISSVDAREAYLQQVCGDEPKIKRRVSALLQDHVENASFLEAPPPGLVPELTLDEAHDRVGTLIGPYKLLEQIGEGGMGVVYVAEQTEPVRRRVALKIIKPGMDTRQVIARFEAERQALAMMDHPHIAKVLDAGTTDAGRPYFVMELVRGLPITEYCDKARLSPRQRLTLFVDVCHAVQHAHQKGVIHRDLKPSNVMITVHDGRPVAKVIDFGVAKAVGQQLTERTVYTAHTQLVGTPLYMSPEQADFSSQDVDTRSDVYSLGVLLYELLTGQTPFDKDTLHKAGFDEMRRIIREDEPPRPSHRVSTLNAQASSTISERRGLDERHLGRILRGELDWIVMKALEKDRSRRFESASALAADIQRYLSDEPVLACPPTAMYRFQKFARKHKASLTTAAAIAVCLILGTTVSAWQAARATTAEAQANANADEAQDKAKEATAQRDEAQKQRDEVKALADKLAAKEEQLQRTLYADHIHMAQAAWDNGDVPAMSKLLAQHVPQGDELDRRGFEWQYLNRLAKTGPLLSISMPTLPYTGSQFRISADRTRLFRLKTVRANSTRNGPPTMPSALQAWNLQTGQEEFAVELSSLPDRAASGWQARAEFTPDSAHLVLNTSRFNSATKSSSPGEVKVWETRTGKEVFTLNGVVWKLGGTLDSRFLCVQQENQSVKVWELQTGEQRLTLPGQVPDDVVFSPDGKRLAATYSEWDNSKKAVVDVEIRVWDVQAGQQLKSFQGQADIYELVFSPDGLHLATSSDEDASIKLWDFQTGKDVLTFGWDIESIDELHFNSNGTRLVALGSYENESKERVSHAKLWNAQTGQELLLARADEAQFSPDGKRLALSEGNRVDLSGPDNPRTRVFDAQSGQIMLSVKNAGGKVAFSPDSKRLATQPAQAALFGAPTGGMRIWDLETGDEINHIKGFYGSNLLSFSQDGQRLIGSQGATKVWDVNVEQVSAKKILFPGVRFGGGGDSPTAISSDFTRIAGTSGNMGFPSKTIKIKLFDLQTGQELRTFTGHKENVSCVAFSPDGKRVASSDGKQNSDSPGGAVKVWDAESGKELFTIADLPHPILRLKFSPDGKKLAGTPGNQTAQVWDASSGSELYGLGTRPANYNALTTYRFLNFAFSPEGKRLAWQGKVWDAETGDELVTLQNAENSLRNIDTSAFSPDSKRVVGGAIVGPTNGDRIIGVWDAQTGELLFKTPAINVNVMGNPTFSPDGKRVAGGGKIWDAQTGQFLLSLSSGRAAQVAFSPDGHRLAVVKDYSNEVTIYDATPLPEKP